MVRRSGLVQGGHGSTRAQGYTGSAAYGQRLHSSNRSGLPRLHGLCWGPEHSIVNRTLTSVVLSLVFCASVAGQRFTIVDDDKLPRFVSVSVKPGDPDSRAGGITWPSGRFVQDSADMRS